jgi:AcrR family transcriptional regulator
MAGRKNDRRVGRTQQLLKQSLLSLIRERGFEPLTVQDIIDRANVGRSTFYAHFRDKEDLLVHGLDELRTHLKEIQRQALAKRPGSDEAAFAFSRELSAHASQHADVFRAMVGKRSGVVFQRSFQKLLTELAREEIKALSPRNSRGSAPSEAVVQFVAAGLHGLLSWWADGQMRLTSDEVDTIFRRLALPAVRSAMAPERRGAAS